MIAIGLCMLVLAWLIVRLRDTLIPDNVDGVFGLIGIVGILLMVVGAARWLWLVAP